jgi:vacuolar iron transporter family protein
MTSMKNSKSVSAEIKLEDEILTSEEFQKGSMAVKLNWLRAAVLGANDGIVATAGLVMGVAAANPTNTGAIFVAGVAGVVAGSISMAGGEYTSVSAQRDSELAALDKERKELAEHPRWNCANSPGSTSKRVFPLKPHQSWPRN